MIYAGTCMITCILSSSQLRKRQASYHEQDCTTFLKAAIRYVYDQSHCEGEDANRMVFDHVKVLQDTGGLRTKGAFQG